ncbi:MAG: chemotaxis protein CheB [Vicinamibacteria bacterium]
MKRKLAPVRDSKTKARKTETPPRAGGPTCPVVGVGASAGGLEALTQLLHALPVDTGMAFVLVQHLSPDHPSALAEILSRATAMPVMEVKDKPQVEPNRVYVIPPGRVMFISEGALQLVARESHEQPRPIDQFLRSLAEDQGHRAIGVILSGTGSDGTLGLEEIKGAGGITFAQDDTALQESMPRSAIASGCVDFVLPPNGIAEELSQIGSHPYLASGAAPTPSALTAETDLSKVLQLLRQTAGLDFTQYKQTTLYRRISRRMALHKMEGLKEYARFLQSSPEEAEALCQDILINVTSFFRNPESFEAVEASVLPGLFRARSQDEPIRVWVVGCSTGEEAYSLAILTQELAESTRSVVPAQIFATDVNAVCVEKARAGFYSKNIAQDVSPERLRRFFTEVDGKYRITKSVRDTCIFAEHDVLSDPPFSRMDLISCRNLLIYLEPALQEKVLLSLHYALNPHGSLWLGSSEATGANRDLFEPVDAKHKIYSKKLGPGRLTLGMPFGRKASGVPATRLSRREESGEAELYKEADRILSAKYVPPGVLVDANMDILQFRGNTGPFLTPAPGKAALNLLKMAREGLLVPLRAALRRARNDRARVRQESVRVKSNGGSRHIALEVIPLEGPGGAGVFFLVLFEEVLSSDLSAPSGGTDARPIDATGPDADSREEEVTRLTQELASTREYLQSVTEQYDAGIEELQSANEEAQSANEELQSVNEELETSKEEIQSSSEELVTLNDELNRRNLELGQINDDLVNLVASVQVAIVMVGGDLRIRRITPTVEKLLSLIPADLGRPIGNINLPISLPDLVPLLTEVIGTVTAREREIRDKGGRRYSLRVRPYKTLDNKIDGAVLMLVDVDAMSRALELAEGIMTTIREPMVVLDDSLRVWLANPAFHRTFHLSPEETKGRPFSELLDRHWDIRELRSLLERILQDASTIESFRVEHDSDMGKRIMILNARRLAMESEMPSLILLAMEDVTEQEKLEDALRGRVEELREADRAKNQFLAMLAHELRGPLAPLRAAASVLNNPATLPDVTRQTHDIVDRQVRAMARLINDLLDVSRATQGKVRLQRETIELSEIVTRAVETQRHLIEERSQELSIELPPQPIYLEADPVRLVQVFGNLLHNASKYGNEGGRIWLSAELLPGGSVEEPGKIVLRVRDDGMGIHSEMLPLVFDMFAQADASLARSDGGLGIGLTMVRNLVDAHGGRVEAESAGLGRGAEFSVHLLALSSRESEREGRARPANPEAGPRASRRVLVVDDNRDAAELLAAGLRLEGHSVETAHSGPEALSKAAAFEPDAVVLDIGLPGMDGYEVARKLREEPRLTNALLVALSGYGQDEDRSRAREAGFDHHLTKPVHLDEINVLLGAGDGRERS